RYWSRVVEGEPPEAEGTGGPGTAGRGQTPGGGKGGGNLFFAQNPPPFRATPPLTGETRP
ncbi:MAG: hypothetical protein LBE14_06590, partial [Treponema sp.]|nr:hypothetical protein [Treponema sp.]